jgi:plastocyanin
MRHRIRQAAIVFASLAGATVACSRPAPRTHTVTIRNFGFAPVALTVAPGDTVVWSNVDFVPHTATATDSGWDSKSIDANASWRFVARTAGRHEYYCAFHPTMKATITVAER